MNDRRSAPKGRRPWMVEGVILPRAIRAGRALNGLDDGGRSSVGRAPDCDSGRRGFESHRPPHFDATDRTPCHDGRASRKKRGFSSMPPRRAQCASLAGYIHVPTTGSWQPVRLIYEPLTERSWQDARSATRCRVQDVPADRGTQVVHRSGTEKKPRFFLGTERSWQDARSATRCGPLAQLVEQLTLNQLVVGSIPTRPTTLPPTGQPRTG